MVFAVVMCADAFAQQQTVLTNVPLTDGTGKPAQRNRTVVIKGDRIQSIAAGHEHTQLSAKVIDLQGQTIMPLITNTHGHLGLTKGTTESAANQTAAGMEQPLPPCSNFWHQHGSAASNSDHLHFEGGLFVCGEYLFSLRRLQDWGGALDHRA